MRISDWSSDVCSSDLLSLERLGERAEPAGGVERLVGDAVEREVLDALQRQHLDALALVDRLGRVAVLVDQPVGRPGEVVVERVGRSEERRVGKECVSTCSSRWSPYP